MRYHCNALCIHAKRLHILDSTFIPFWKLDHSMAEEALIKLLKFTIIGTGGTTLDFGITFYLKEKAKWNQYLANSLGFMLAATSNYIFNRIWAFKSDSDQVLAQYLAFLAISLTGLGVLNLLLWVFNEKCGWNFYFSKILALMVVLVWTFSGHYYFTFSRI